MAEAYIPGQGWISYRPGPLGIPPKGSIPKDVVYSNPIFRRLAGIGGEGGSPTSSSSESMSSKRAANEAKRRAAAEAARKAAEAREKAQQEAKAVAKKFTNKRIQAFVKERARFLRGEGNPITSARRSREEVQKELEKFSKKSQYGRYVSPKEAGKFIALGLADSITSAITGLADTPGAIKSVIKNPGTIKKIPSTLATDAAKFGRVAKTNPAYAVGRVGGEILLFKGSSRAISSLEKAGTNVLGKTVYKEVKRSPLGVKVIRNVKGVGDIQVVRTKNLDIDIPKLVKKLPETKILRKTPKIPTTSPIKKEIINIVKKNDDAITGSFASEALLKKQFARPHKDLDILTRNRKALIRDIKKKLGNKVTFRKLKNSIEVRYKGKAIADLVKLGVGEEGFAKKFGFFRHDGLNLVSPRARLGGKLTKLSKTSMRRIDKKTLKDIEDLFGKKANLNIPAIRGAFGYSSQELRKFIGKSGPIVTGQADLLAKGIFKPSELKLKKFLFASPPVKGKGQLRTSRLGLTPTEEATIRDLMRGDITFRKPKSQIFVFPKEKIFAASKKVKKASKKRIAPTPRGFVVPEFSSELEVVLGTPFTIKRGKVLTKVNLNGQLVPIVELKKIKLSSSTRKLSKELESLKHRLSKNIGTRSAVEDNKKLLEKLSKGETKLIKNLERETGFKYRASFSPASKKYLSLRKLLVSLRPLRPKPSKEKEVPVSKKIRKSEGPLTKKVYGKGLVGRGTNWISSQESTSRKTGRGRPTRVAKTLAIRGKSKFKAGKSKKLIGMQMGKVRKPIERIKKGYDVYGKSKGRFIKLNKLPLKKQDALSRGAYALDNSTSRTMKLMPARKVSKVGSIKQKEKNYYSKNRAKLRKFKIAKRQKKPIGSSFIEKTKYAIDTKGEKNQLSLARLINKEGYRKRRTSKAKYKKSKLKKKVAKRRTRRSYGFLG